MLAQNRLIRIEPGKSGCRQDPDSRTGRGARAIRHSGEYSLVVSCERRDRDEHDMTHTIRLSATTAMLSRTARSGCMAALGVLFVMANVLSAEAAQPWDLIPSARYLVLSSPWRPTSYDECNALYQEFAQEIAMLNAQHDACLQDSPSDESSGGSCSKISCQGLHSARDSAYRRSNDETSTCRRKVSEFQAEQRREEQRRQQAEADRARAEAERAREENERKARREAERQKDEQERRDREARRGRERQEREARDERERQEQTARSKAESERRERERLAQETQAKAARERQERYERYLEVLQQAQEARDQVDTAIELVKNPFDKIKEMATDALSDTLVEKALDETVSIGPEKHDSRYDAVAAGADKARSTALADNPFADKVSGQASAGVQKIHRQLLGQMDELGRQMDRISSTDTAPPKATGSDFRPTPPPSTSSQSRPANSDNPFTKRSTPGAVALTEGAGTAAAFNPFEKRRTGAPGFDSSDGVDAVYIPSGYTLYRNPSTDRLTVVRESDVKPSKEDDRIVDGQLRCSASGRGIVLAECEKQRASNPFSGKPKG